MKPVNEDSAKTFRVRFYSTSGDEVTPSNARWKLFDYTNSRVVQDWTVVAVTGSTLDIALSAALHEIYDTRKAYQDHALAVQADWELASQATDEVTYKVKNLKAARR